MRWIRAKQRALTGIAPHNANPAPAALVPIKRVGLADIPNPLGGYMTCRSNSGVTFWGFFEGTGSFGSWSAGHLYQLTGQTSGQVSCIFKGKVQPHPTAIQCKDELNAQVVTLNWNVGLGGYAAVDSTMSARWQGQVGGAPFWVTLSW